MNLIIGMLIKEHPELFPPEIAFGYKMKEIRVSKKLNLKIRRIVIAGVSYTIRPSFAMPYMTGFVKDVDEKHTRLLGEKTYIATTTGSKLSFRVFHERALSLHGNFKNFFQANFFEKPPTSSVERVNGKKNYLQGNVHP